MYKGVLDRETLRSEGGVGYFKDTFRPHFIKGALSVFFWMCFQVIRARRENMEMVKWIEHFSLLLKRLRDSGWTRYH